MEPETVRGALEPVVARLGLELVDVEVVGQGRARTLRVTVDREGGVDLDAITSATQAVSPELDQLDPFGGTYTLEVSSPGVERPLRRPAEFRRFVGTPISVKTTELVGDQRRWRGALVAADDDGIDLRPDEPGDGETVRISYDAIATARTVFEWGPAPKPGGPRPARQSGSTQAKSTQTRQR